MRLFSVGFFLVGCLTCFAQVKQPVLVLSQVDSLRSTFSGVRGEDLSKLDLRTVDLFGITFDSFTEWPSRERLPVNFDPEEILEWGKAPGLGVGDLHAKGITGKGVHVAIVDQPLLTNHVEYAHQLVQYTIIECLDAHAQYHGAVASLLAGKSCGVAPGALLHYWALPIRRDYRFGCEALKQIIDYNRRKPLDERIRVVSVSMGLNSWPNLDEWKQLIQLARSEGIYVVHCGDDYWTGAACPVLGDKDHPASYEACAFLRRQGFQNDGNWLLVPIDNRTTSHFRGNTAYIFDCEGGTSWGAPFLAGAVALAIQVNPLLSPDQIREYLIATAAACKDGKIVDPVAFVEKAAGLK